MAELSCNNLTLDTLESGRLQVMRVDESLATNSNMRGDFFYAGNDSGAEDSVIIHYNRNTGDHFDHHSVTSWHLSRPSPDCCEDSNTDACGTEMSDGLNKGLTQANQKFVGIYAAAFMRVRQHASFGKYEAIPPRFRAMIDPWLSVNKHAQQHFDQHYVEFINDRGNGGIIIVAIYDKDPQQVRATPLFFAAYRHNFSLVFFVKNERLGTHGEVTRYLEAPPSAT